MKYSQNPLTAGSGDSCVEKGPSLRKGEIRPHFSVIPQTERMFFHSAASKIARMFAKLPGFVCGLSAASEPTHQRKHHKKQ